MTTKPLRKKYGITQRWIAETYEIPLNTIKSWDSKECMPWYVYKLLDLTIPYYKRIEREKTW